MPRSYSAQHQPSIARERARAELGGDVRDGDDPPVLGADEHPLVCLRRADEEPATVGRPGQPSQLRCRAEHDAAAERDPAHLARTAQLGARRAFPAGMRPQTSRWWNGWRAAAHPSPAGRRCRLRENEQLPAVARPLERARRAQRRVIATSRRPCSSGWICTRPLVSAYASSNPNPVATLARPRPRRGGHRGRRHLCRPPRRRVGGCPRDTRSACRLPIPSSAESPPADGRASTGRCRRARGSQARLPARRRRSGRTATMTPRRSSRARRRDPSAPRDPHSAVGARRAACRRPGSENRAGLGMVDADRAPDLVDDGPPGRAQRRRATSATATATAASGRRAPSRRRPGLRSAKRCGDDRSRCSPRRPRRRGSRSARARASLPSTPPHRVEPAPQPRVDRASREARAARAISPGV